MIKVWFINFNYYAQEEFITFEEAIKYAQKCQFQVRFEKENKILGCWCPILGLKRYENHSI